MPSTVQKWMDFFLDAGIPDATAATYATNFASNRMEMSMLGELTKEVLKELDITLMGDIITVMRHAKIVAEKQRSDKVIDDKKKARDLPESLKPYEPQEKKVTEPKRTFTKKEEPKYVEKAEKKPKKTITIKYSDTDTKKEPIKVKPEAKYEKEDSSVFNRLGRQNPQEDVKQEELKRKPIIKPITFNDDDVKTENLKKTKVTMRSLKQEKASAFDRLDRPDNTQDERVSSTVDPPDKATTSSVQSPVSSKGILKQRKAGMSRSLSASSIISLKPQQTTKKRARVSFGENDVRLMSPMEPEGIKARLGYNKDSSSDEEDLSERADLRARMQTLVRQKGETGGIRRVDEPKKHVVEDEPVVATLVKRKKVYVLQTLSDGTQKKVELPPHHPYLQNKARQSPATAGSQTVQRRSPPPQPREMTRQTIAAESSDEEEEVQTSLARRVTQARQDRDVRDRLVPKMEPSSYVKMEQQSGVMSRLEPIKSEPVVVRPRLESVRSRMDQDVRLRLEPVKTETAQVVRPRLEPVSSKIDQDVRVRMEPSASYSRMEQRAVAEQRVKMEPRMKMEAGSMKMASDYFDNSPPAVRRKPEPVVVRQFSAESKYAVQDGGRFQTLASRASRSASFDATERVRSRSETDLGRMRSVDRHSADREPDMGRLRLAEDTTRKRRLDQEDYRHSAVKVRLHDPRDVDVVDLDAYEEKIAIKEARLRTMSEQLLHADAGRPSRQLYQAGGTSDRYTAADSRFAGDSSRSALQADAARGGGGSSAGGTMRADELSRGRPTMGQRLAPSSTSSSERSTISRERSRSPVRAQHRVREQTSNGIYARLGPKSSY